MGDVGADEQEQRDGVEVAGAEGEAAVGAAHEPPCTDGQRAEDSGVQGQPEPVRLPREQQVAVLEALLLAHGEPLSIGRVQELLSCARAEVMALVGELQEQCRAPQRGCEVVVVAEKLQLRTKAAYAEYVRVLMAVKPRKLSQAALETLAVIAYRQPVVKSEVDKIRGVDGAPTIKTLVERGLIKILGYQATVGQPALYGTTDDFLKTFGLSSLTELPTLRDLTALAREPGEVEDSDAEPLEAATEAAIEAEGRSDVAEVDAEGDTGAIAVSAEEAVLGAGSGDGA
jgi:segregation and condensation protein B